MRVVVVLLFLERILISPTMVDSFIFLKEGGCWSIIVLLFIFVDFAFLAYFYLSFMRLAYLTILNITLSRYLNYPIYIWRILFIVSSLIIYSFCLNCISSNFSTSIIKAYWKSITFVSSFYFSQSKAFKSWIEMFKCSFNWLIIPETPANLELRELYADKIF
jgi:hypothetical protein